jgi:hypothetical protein
MKYAIKKTSGGWWTGTRWGHQRDRDEYTRDELPIMIGENLLDESTMTYSLDAEGGGLVARVVEV